MSGSYDRPDGRRSTLQPAAAFDPYDDVLTGPHTGTGPADAQHYHYPPPLEAKPEPQQQSRPDMHAPAPTRRKRTERKQTHAPVVPPDTVTGRSLTLVISIMCFLACLTAGTVYMINESAKAWKKDIASEVTVQITPQENVDTEKTVADVKAFLEKRNGIARARPLALDDMAALLEPWLGQTDALGELPVPRLIAVEMDRQSQPDIDTLKADLAKEFPNATLDDHRRWQAQIRTVTRSFALGGLAILLLVAAATTAIIISATRSSMASNREIVEVLHFVGATDRYIAREFEKHFLRLGIRAGLVGAVCAMAVFFSMTTIMQMLGGGEVTVAEVQRLIGTGGLDAIGYLLLGSVVIIIAALCMLTSRFGVFRILNSKP
jgi:cell division transport system permease protein